MNELTVSTGTRRGARATGAPAGKKKEAKSSLCLAIHLIVKPAIRVVLMATVQPIICNDLFVREKEHTYQFKSLELYMNMVSPINQRFKYLCTKCLVQEFRR